jgi:long-chain acyl-CoA synthetase
MARLLAAHAERDPDRHALTDIAGTTRWGDFNARVNRLVNGFRALGLSAGDLLAIVAGNSRECFEVMAAAGHSGILFVPVNWHFTAEELAYVVADSGAKLLICDAQFAPLAQAAVARNETPALQHCLAIGGSVDGFSAYEDFVAAQVPDEPDGQVLGGPMFYTSGTTGRPKGVKSAAKSGPPPLETMQMMGAGMAGMLSIPPDGVTLLCGPVYHSAQWAFSYLPLIAGSSVVMRHKFDAAEVLTLIDRYAVTNVHLVPTQFHRLLGLDAATRAAFHGGSLKAVWHGAAPCPPAIKRRMLDWWGDVIHESSGPTEGCLVTTASAAEWRARPGTLGRTTPMAEIRIVRDNGTLAEPGEPGQIYVKNRLGADFEYHNEPAKTAAAHLEPGVFTFGDVGSLDADGYLFMSDRKIDMIISGGVNIYPAEIEAVLLAHPSVQDAAVFGIPDEEFGESVKAAVQLEPSATPGPALEATLIAHCRDHLAGYKAPRSIDFIDAMPRHPTGKLYKRLLRDPYWEGSGRRI